ncbi:hypothetical protein Clacol_001300 [Clathrus columnatus]|uniref:DUF221-domain-containing protein n=1 Tax=Clathrus columnatus TaxID=1419009 RepID=A0AAV5A265_9AGAM|nr:hypothetical protein Clacol_001300 [Clathrus columnatus]
MTDVFAVNATSKTTQTFVTSLVTNTILLGVEVIAFSYLKDNLSRVYTPRTYLPPPEKRAEELPPGRWRWILSVGFASSTDIINKNGLDAYLFLRFLRLMIIIFSTFTVITWSIILPVDTANINSQADGLNKLSWGNIPNSETKRYAAHIVIVYLLTFFVIYLIRLEFFHFIEMRQAYLTSTSQSHCPQGRTVLVTSIPHDMCTEKTLRIWGAFIPGGIQNIWIYRDTKELNDAYFARLKACNELEDTLSKLLRQAALEKSRKERIYAKEMAELRDHDVVLNFPEFSSPRRPSAGESVPDTPISLSRIVPDILSSKSHISTDLERNDSPVSQYASEKALLDELVPPSKRPSEHRGFLGLWGLKLDKYELLKDEIAQHNNTIKFLRAHERDDKPLGSAFIQCNLQMGAHVLAQCLSHHTPLKMTTKWLQVTPKDVIWANIDDGIYKTRFRYLTSWLLNIGVVVIWFFPTTFVGLLSNVSQLCTHIKWLAWVCKAHAPIPGILQGVFPPILLAISFAILPWILRALAWYENIPLYSLLSISVYKRYFMFLVIHGFLIVTLTSGLTATANDLISNPTKAVSELASHLPDASVFFLTWTGLTGAGSALLQLVDLSIYYFKKWYMGRTPRQTFAVTFNMPSTDFGVVMPQMSLLATIGLAYSVLSPIINGLATLAFALYYFVWKFLLTWVFDQPPEHETVAGLYVEQFCLTALFFLKGSTSNHTFIAQGVFMVVLMVITLTAQLFIRQSFQSLVQYLPMTLAMKRIHAKMERRWRHRISKEKENKLEHVDLFDRKQLNILARKTGKAVETIKAEIKAGLAETVKEAKTTSAAHSAAVDRPSTTELRQTTSRASNTSSKSKHSKSSPKLVYKKFDRGEDTDSSGDDLDFDENGFQHPSSYEEQPWIWIPKDELGLSRYLVAELRSSGVLASDEGATINEEGNVVVTRGPPDHPQ